jgi:hypothetical protein
MGNKPVLAEMSAHLLFYCIRRHPEQEWSNKERMIEKFGMTHDISLEGGSDCGASAA